MKRRNLGFPLLLILALTLLSGCSSALSNTPNSEAETQRATEAQKAVTEAVIGEVSVFPAVDRAGNAIAEPAKLDGIISLAPSVTQTLIHLGVGGKLIAVDNNSADLEGIPDGIMTVDILNPDSETLISLEPDMIIASGLTGSGENDPLSPFREDGRTIVYVPTSNSIGDIYLDVMFLADIVGEHDKGTEIIEELKAGIKEIADKTAGAEKKTVYFEIASAPYAYSFGSDTFMNEMIDIAGGENIFGDMKSWIAVSEEQVVERNPDVIFTNVTYVDDAVGEILSRDSLQGTAAVEKSQVYFIDNYSSSLSNEYIFTALRQMARALHPELW